MKPMERDAMERDKIGAVEVAMVLVIKEKVHACQVTLSFEKEPLGTSRLQSSTTPTPTNLCGCLKHQEPGRNHLFCHPMDHLLSKNGRGIGIFEAA